MRYSRTERERERERVIFVDVEVIHIIWRRILITVWRQHQPKHLSKREIEREGGRGKRCREGERVQVE